MSDLAKKFLAKWEFEHIEAVARSVRDEQARRLALQCREDAAKAGISTQDLELSTNTWVEYGVHDGVGCDTKAYMDHHFTPEELAGKPVPDQHWHEHATCFRVGDRGLVVITSCGHGGIINTLKRAREITGVEKIYALVGGFHLAPAPNDYLASVMAELKKFDVAFVMPMHCSGQNFIDLAKQEMPEKLVLCGTGSSFTFTA